MSYVEAQDEGFHDFADYGRFICLPAQYPSMAPGESTRWLMLKELEQCLQRGSTLLVLVPEASKKPPPAQADDEPFNSTRQFLREVTGVQDGAYLADLPSRRQPHVRVCADIPPGLRTHLERHPPHFLTEWAGDDRIVLAECGAVQAKDAILAGKHGAGLWAALPWRSDAPSEGDLLGLAVLLDELAQLPLEPDTSRDGDPPVPVDADAAQSNRFVREGETWSISFEGRSIRLKHVEGLEAIARILLANGTPVDPFEILGRAKPSQTKPDEVWDAKTRKDVAAAKEDLKARIAALDASTDLSSLEEREQLQTDLDEFDKRAREATGLRGRSRSLDPSYKRAQDALRARIQPALERIKVHDSALFEHLDAALRTGRYKAYVPADRTVSWQIRL